MRDIHSSLYLKLTSKMPESWSTVVRGCEHAYAAELQAYSDSSCSGQVNASGVMEWKSIDWNGCISVLAGSPSLPLYAQRTFCNGTDLVLDVFADGFCRSDPHFRKPFLRRSVPRSVWQELLLGHCVRGEPFGSTNFLKLSGLSVNDLAKLSAATSCLPEPSTLREVGGGHLAASTTAGEPTAPATATTRQPNLSTTITRILDANAAREPGTGLMLVALPGAACLAMLFA